MAIAGRRALFVEDASTATGVTVTRRVQNVTPGTEYQLQGYSYAKTGRQVLAMRFVTAENSLVSRVGAPPSSGAVMAWSRNVVTAVAPAKATAVVVELSTTAATTSTGWWDAVKLITPGLANGGFEDAATPTSWTVTAPQGTSAAVTSATARLGRNSLLLPGLARALPR